MKPSLFLSMYVLLMVGGALPASESGQRTATLQGTVRDYNGAVYVCEECSVTISGESLQRTLPLDNRGSFRNDLPPGIYTITTRIPGTYPLRRAAFRLNPGETATLDLVPRLRILATATEVTDKGLKDKRELAPPSRFEELNLDGDARMKAVVEFESRVSRKRTLLYKDAVVSYDTVTIYADSVIYDRSSGSFEATGDTVTVDLGGTRKVVRRVKARLTAHRRCFEY